MARPVKCRRVASLPKVTFFKPAGIPLRDLKDVGLTVEEVEAIRLRDLEGLWHQQCAERMHISRPTFHRVLRSARRKVADVLLNGKALRIEGGSFALDRQPYRCCVDGHEWHVRFEDAVSGRDPACPRCQSLSVAAIHSPGRGARAGRGRRRGGRGGRMLPNGRAAEASGEC